MNQQPDYQKSVEGESELDKSPLQRQDEVPWGTREAWWGILGLIGLDIFFQMIIAALIVAKAITLPSPLIIGLITALLYGTIVWLLYYLAGKRFNAFAFREFPLFKSVIYIVLSFIGVYIFEIAWLFILQLLRVSPPKISESLIQMFGLSVVSYIVIFLLTVVIAPIVEEMFFRSFLYQAFRKKYGVTLGIMISALLFGLFHFSFLVVLPVYFLIGVLLGYVFEKFQSVYPSMMLHALNNLVFFLILVLLLARFINP